VGRNPKWALARAATLLISSIIVFKFILMPIRISGISMEPTYRDGRINFVNRLAYMKNGPARYDVVTIRMAGPSIQYFKRVVGLPGETVAIRRGVIYINGEPLPEPYLSQRSPKWEYPERSLGPDEYFVVGDNRAIHPERHDFGVAERKRILGKVIL
jgi:signal peptidase I